MVISRKFPFVEKPFSNFGLFSSSGRENPLIDENRKKNLP